MFAKKIEVKKGSLIYDNPLSSEALVKDFILEGEAKISFIEGRMQMENILPPNDDDNEAQQKANFVYWCPENFPSDIIIEWDFWPIREVI